MGTERMQLFCGACVVTKQVRTDVPCPVDDGNIMGVCSWEVREKRTIALARYRSMEVMSQNLPSSGSVSRNVLREEQQSPNIEGSEGILLSRMGDSLQFQRLVKYVLPLGFIQLSLAREKCIATLTFFSLPTWEFSTKWCQQAKLEKLA